MLPENIFEYSIYDPVDKEISEEGFFSKVYSYFKAWFVESSVPEQQLPIPDIVKETLSLLPQHFEEWDIEIRATLDDVPLQELPGQMWVGSTTTGTWESSVESSENLIVEVELLGTPITAQLPGQMWVGSSSSGVWESSYVRPSQNNIIVIHLDDIPLSPGRLWISPVSSLDFSSKVSDSILIINQNTLANLPGMVWVGSASSIKPVLLDDITKIEIPSGQVGSLSTSVWKSKMSSSFSVEIIDKQNLTNLPGQMWVGSNSLS